MGTPAWAQTPHQDKHFSCQPKIWTQQRNDVIFTEDVAMMTPSGKYILIPPHGQFIARISFLLFSFLLFMTDPSTH